MQAKYLPTLINLDIYAFIDTNYTVIDIKK